MNEESRTMQKLGIYVIFNGLFIFGLIIGTEVPWVDALTTFYGWLTSMMMLLCLIVEEAREQLMGEFDKQPMFMKTKGWLGFDLFVDFVTMAVLFAVGEPVLGGFLFVVNIMVYSFKYNHFYSDSK